MTRKARAALVERLTKDIARERAQYDFCVASNDTTNAQYYLGRMHALLNLKWAIQ
jgi:hypothetical protein